MNTGFVVGCIDIPSSPPVGQQATLATFVIDRWTCKACASRSASYGHGTSASQETLRPTSLTQITPLRESEQDRSDVFAIAELGLQEPRNGLAQTTFKPSQQRLGRRRSENPVS